jgi:RNA polymerase sigma-70 factor (ECF subfamily)
MHGHEGRTIDIESCYLRYGAMVWRRCRRLLRDEDEAYDTMQEVFVKLIEYQERVYSDYMSSLLYRIATNLCLNKLRLRRRRGPVESLETVAAVSGQEDRRSESDYRELLEEILQGEIEDVRQIAFMYFFDGMKMQKIAAVMSMSTTAVHTRLKKLRRRIQEAENE